MRIFAALVGVSLLAGCYTPLGADLSDDRSQVTRSELVQVGMTKQEVESLWGTPAAVQSGETEVWVYELRGQEYVTYTRQHENERWRPTFGTHKFRLKRPYRERRTVEFDAEGRVEHVDRERRFARRCLCVSDSEL